MATMGKYCKAYLLSALRKFEGWEEKRENTRKEPGNNNGKEGESPRPLDDDAILYLQENYYVTDGIFLDENIIFDKVSPEWIEFCQQTLEFETPEDIGIE